MEYIDGGGEVGRPAVMVFQGGRRRQTKREEMRGRCEEDDDMFMLVGLLN